MKNKVFLVQTDTTVGFLSKDSEKLSKIKGRSKKSLEVVPDFHTLKDNTRVPDIYKSMVRRAKKTTFIYPNMKAFRVVDRDDEHSFFLKKHGKLYSTSANYTGKTFNYDFAYNNCDVIVESSKGFSESTPSTIYKLNNIKIIKIR